jgi:hypothetical protein
MANKYTKKQIQEFPKRNYQSIRNDLKTGDLVFCSGNYLFSKAIQKFTKSVWSHVGVIYKDETLDRVLILESETGIGVRLAPVSKYVEDYHGKKRPYKGNMIIGRVVDGIPDDKMKTGISFGLDELTKPYDNYEILRIAFRILFGISRRTQDRKYICSELVQEIYRRAGYVFPFNDTIISPDDIWGNKKVQMLYRLM